MILVYVDTLLYVNTHLITEVIHFIMSLYNDLTTKYVQNKICGKYCVCILIKTIKHTVASVKLTIRHNFLV